MPALATNSAAVLPDAPPGGVTAGLDWATTNHAITVVNARGTVVDRFVVDAAAAGLRELVRRPSEANNPLRAWTSDRLAGRYSG
ncbi:MAG TPA: hypothetical protein VE709_08695 [Pseudonocardiaceae bacterium]|nr:hypothetical protein [Pseudonocardiaceae bacterium]